VAFLAEHRRAVLAPAATQIDDQGQKAEGQNRQDDAQAEQLLFHIVL